MAVELKRFQSPRYDLNVMRYADLKKTEERCPLCGKGVRVHTSFALRIHGNGLYIVTSVEAYRLNRAGRQDEDGGIVPVHHRCVYHNELKPYVTRVRETIVLKFSTSKKLEALAASEELTPGELVEKLLKEYRSAG